MTAAPEVAPRSLRLRALGLWALVILAVFGGLVVAAYFLVLSAVGSAFFSNDSPPLPDQARTRLERIRYETPFALTPRGATEVESGMSDHACQDWFDGREPSVWRTVERAGPNDDTPASITNAFVRHGWTVNHEPAVAIFPGIAHVDFTRGFGTWTAHVEASVDPKTVKLFGLESGSNYCKTDDPP